MPLFGKRVSAPSTQPEMPQGTRHAPSQLASLPGAPQPGQKIFPDELWEGETGNVLRTIGMKPDDASNFVPTKVSIDARIAHDKAAHEARWAEMNRDVAARTSGGSVQPFFLIPEPCWNGELGDFLVVTLKLSPYQDWNVAFLAADECTASMMSLPVHPNRDDPEIVEYAIGFVTAARDHYKACHEDAGRTREFGRFNDQVEDIADKVRGLAVKILARYGEIWQAPAPP
jgi:hypothetical protein